VCVAHGEGNCEKFGWRRPLRSARLSITSENAHLKECAPGGWTFAGGARLGVRRLDAAFLAQPASSGDVAPLAKAVAALPRSKARTFGPRRRTPKRCAPARCYARFFHTFKRCGKSPGTRLSAFCPSRLGQRKGGAFIAPPQQYRERRGLRVCVKTGNSRFVRLCRPAVRKASGFPARRQNLCLSILILSSARKGSALPHSGAAEPPVFTQTLKARSAKALTRHG
jgi:hypothetical protein